MALTPPTTTATPVTQAEANAAFAAINAFVTTAYSELSAALTVAREHVRITNGSVRLLDELDANMRTLNSSALADPTVASNPGTFAQVNNALVTMASFVDRLNSRSNTALGVLREALRLSDGTVLRLDRFDTSTRNLSSPATLTAEAVATDVGPGTVFTEVNTALADTTAFVDDANSEITATLNEFLEQYPLRAINDRYARMSAAVAALS